MDPTGRCARSDTGVRSSVTGVAMQENAPQAAAVGVRAPPAADVAMDEDDDPELAAALAMSMAETQPGTSTEARYFPLHCSV